MLLLLLLSFGLTESFMFFVSCGTLKQWKISLLSYTNEKMVVLTTHPRPLDRKPYIQ